jgi:hypothetical protein
VRFDSGAGDDLTVREWLCKLLTEVWSRQECFNSKRPWGNGGWEHDVIIPLAKAGFIDLGPANEDGDFLWTAEQMVVAHAYVADLIIAAMFGVCKGVGT